MLSSGIIFAIMHVCIVDSKCGRAFLYEFMSSSADFEVLVYAMTAIFYVLANIILITR